MSITDHDLYNMLKNGTVERVISSLDHSEAGRVVMVYEAMLYFADELKSGKKFMSLYTRYDPSKSRGVGDTIAKITKKFGIKPCGGCKKRQAAFNKTIPYKR
jgi:hypothetical protein